MTLRDLYNDINSLLTSEGLDVSNIFFTDILHAINDSIDSARLKMVSNGVTSPFTIEKEIAIGLQKRTVPYMNEANLDVAPIQELPLSMTVVTALAHITPHRLTPKPKEWKMGTRAVMKNVLYEAYNDIPEVDSTSLTFDPLLLRHYSMELSYEKGDLVLDSSGGKVYKATADFVASGTIGDDPLEEVYWAKINDDATMDASVLPYEQKRDMKVMPLTITINGSKLYTTTDIGRVFVEYVPEWEPVEELDEELDLPTSLLQGVKMDVIKRLSTKLRTSQVKGGSDE